MTLNSCDQESNTRNTEQRKANKMEAVPRMSMLSLELKESAERVEFGPVIKPVSLVDCIHNCHEICVIWELYGVWKGSKMSREKWP